MLKKRRQAKAARTSSAKSPSPVKKPAKPNTESRLVDLTNESNQLVAILTTIVKNSKKVNSK